MNVQYIEDFIERHGPAGTHDLTPETEVFLVVDGETMEFTMEMSPDTGRVFIVADGD